MKNINNMYHYNYLDLSFQYFFIFMYIFRLIHHFFFLFFLKWINFMTDYNYLIQMYHSNLIITHNLHSLSKENSNYYLFTINYLLNYSLTIFNHYHINYYIFFLFMYLCYFLLEKFKEFEISMGNFIIVSHFIYHSLSKLNY